MSNKFIHVHRSSNEKSKKHPLVVLLHGYGSNENDLFSFQSFFPENHTIVSFRAPLTVFEGMYAWYEIYFENNVKSFNENTAKNSSNEIVDEIKLICKQYNCDVNNITLEDAIRLINVPKTTGILREFPSNKGESISIRTGKYGPYIYFKNEHMKRPIFKSLGKVKWKEMTLSDVEAILE